MILEEAEEGRAAARFAGERSGCTTEDFAVREGEGATVDCDTDGDVDEKRCPRGGRAGDLREKIALPPPTADDAESGCVAASALGADAGVSSLSECALGARIFCSISSNRWLIRLN